MIVHFWAFAQQKKSIMNTDNPDIHIILPSSQATLLLERLETLRDELGMVGEDLITLLRGAGVSPLVAEPSSSSKNKTGLG